MGVLKIPWPGMKIDSLFFEGSWVFFWIEQKTECKIIENQNQKCKCRGRVDQSSMFEYVFLYN